jgi:uncharacterized delta-60 repeat protein
MAMRRTVTALALAAALAAPAAAAAHPGALDPAFGGGDGEVALGFGGASAVATAVAPTADGGTIVAGRVSTATPAFDIGLVALDAAGNPRAGFGSGGTLDVAVPALHTVASLSPVMAVAQRPDGSYLVAAAGLNLALPEVLVTSVSAGGVASPVVAFGLPAPLGAITGLAIDSATGFIYVAGPAGAKTLGLIRLTAAGTQDLGFGTGGVAQQMVDAGANATIGRVVLQSDGKAIVVANGTQADNTTHEISAVRFTTAGQPDPTYGLGGVATLANTPATAQGAGLGAASVSAAGLAVLGNRAAGGIDVVRFTPAGQPATSFGQTGVVAVGNGGFAVPTDLALADDGSVIVIGSDQVATAGGTGTRFSAYANRLNADGSHDTTFGDNPINGYGPFASWFNGATDLYVQQAASVLTPAGLVAVGTYAVAGAVPGPTQFAAARIVTAADPVNRPPTVSLAVAPSSGSTAKAFAFTARASDPDGSVVRYEWDFDGDGVVDRVTSGGSASYQYARKGSFTARVTVFDNAGASASATVGVRVSSASEDARTALRKVGGKLTLAKKAVAGKRSLSVALSRVSTAACPCPYFAIVRRGSTVVDAKQGTVDRRHLKIAFGVRARHGQKLTETVRLLDTFANRVDLKLKLTVK